MSAQEYLQQMFAINPVWQSRAALDLRRKAFRLANHDPTETSAGELASQRAVRQQTRADIADLQEKFFQLTAEELQQALAKLSPERTPELAATIHRLQTAGKLRPTLAAMIAEGDCDKELIVTLGKAITLPPSDAGYVREQYIQGLVNKQRRKLARRSSEVIAKQQPELFALERDWLTTLQTLRANNTSAQGSFFNVNGRVVFFALLIAFQVGRVIWRLLER